MHPQRLSNTIKEVRKQQRRMHLYEHTKYFHTDVEPSFFNSSNCFIKVLTDNVTVNVGLSKY